MGCPICGRVYCDHTPGERSQSHEEMTADCYGMSVEEYRRQTAPKKQKRSRRKRKTRNAKKNERSLSSNDTSPDGRPSGFSFLLNSPFC